MSPFELTPTDRVITDVMEQHDLDEGFRRSLRRMIEREDDSWRVCCGNGCDPCVLALGRAVDTARARLKKLEDP